MIIYVCIFVVLSHKFANSRLLKLMCYPRFNSLCQDLQPHVMHIIIPHNIMCNTNRLLTLKCTYTLSTSCRFSVDCEGLYYPLIKTKSFHYYINFNNRVQLEHRDHRVQEAKTERGDLQDHQVIREREDPQETKATLVWLEDRDLKDLKDHL